MNFISKIFLIFSLTFSITANANDIDVPKPLNKNDEDLYKEIFALQNEGNFQEADKLTEKIENKILIGRVKAQKYLHPTGYISKFIELKEWLKNYNDHPSASRIYWLSERKKPKNYKSAKKPSGGIP